MIYDVIGVGFGPSNIALAIAMEESGYQGSTLFFEKSTDALWHNGMLLDGSDIQNNSLRDLITPVNPRSKYTFTNFLHENGKFFHYLNLGLHHPLRKDYFLYVKWVAQHFPNVIYDVQVSQLRMIKKGNKSVWCLTANGKEYHAKSVVLGVGRNLNIPAGLEENERIVHLSHYLPSIQALPKSAPVAVLGASQSAVEILCHLLSSDFTCIYAIHRSFSFRLKDTSPFSDEVYFPEFIDYYHAIPHDKRMQLDRQVRPTNYSSADADVLQQLYLKMYELKLDGIEPLRIFRNHKIVHVTRNNPLVVDIEEIYTGKHSQLEIALLILATGYLDVGRNGKEGLPYLLKELSQTFSWTADCLNVSRDYRVEYTNAHKELPDLYLNGLCESSHGMGDAGSFSLVSIRAREILNSIIRNKK